MNAAAYGQVRALFDHGITLAEDDRARFLDHLRRDDPSLHAAVDRLLALDCGEGVDEGFLASPIRAAARRAGRRRTWADGEPRADDPSTIRDSQATSNPAPMFPTIAGYTILGELGRGAMGVVYHARRHMLNRPCALKMILARSHAGAEASARFRSEAEAIARLRHPNVVRIHTIGESDGAPYLELEYVEGGSLDRVLDGTPWPADRAARLVEDLARGLAEAHRLGVVHRDLKPANVLIDKDGTPKITDFGLARLIDADSGITAIGTIMGTPNYMAPEQAAGRSHEAGAAADVYSLGAILYELLTGRPPFRGATAGETIEQVKTADPVPPARLVPGLARDLETIALVCLRKEPARRYPSAEALAEDLRRFRAGEPIAARRWNAMTRASRWCRRNPRLAASIAAAAIGLVAATGLSIALAWVQFQAAERLRIEQANTLAQKRDAEELYRIARAAADDFLLQSGGTLATPDGTLEQIRDLGRTVFDTGLVRYRELLVRRPNDPELRAQVGRLYYTLAEMMKYGRGQTGALETYQQAVAFQRQLVRDYPEDREYQMDLVMSLLNASQIQIFLGSYQEGLITGQECLDQVEAVLESQPDDLTTLKALSVVLLRLGSIRSDTGQRDEGIVLIRRGVDVLDKAVRLAPSDQSCRICLADALAGLGEKLITTDRLDDALDAFSHALTVQEGLIREDPTNTQLVCGVPIILNRIGHAYYGAGRAAEALPFAVESRSRWKTALGDRSYPMPCRAYRGDNLLTLGQVYQALNRFDEALESFRGAEAIHRGLLREDPSTNWYQCSLALARRFQGGLLQRAGRHDEALPALREARAIIEAMPELTNFDRFNLAACFVQTQFLARSGRPVAESGTVPGPDEIQEIGDRAMALFREGAEKTRPRPSRFFFVVDPDLAPLRNRPEFQQLARTYGLTGPLPAPLTAR